MVVFEVFETGVELNAVDDFFPVTEGLESDPDGVGNVINIMLDAFFAAVLVGVSVVLDNVDDDVVDSDDVDAVVATVVSFFFFFSLQVIHTQKRNKNYRE